MHKESEWESEMAEMHTHWSDGAVLLWTSLLFYFILFSWDWHRATLWHWIILVSHYFSFILSFSLPLNPELFGNMTSSSHLQLIFSLPGLCWSLVSADYMIILDTYTNSRGHTFCLYVACKYSSVWHATNSIYVALLLGNNLHPVHFRKHVPFLLCHPCKLCGMSIEDSTQHNHFGC